MFGRLHASGPPETPRDLSGVLSAVFYRNGVFTPPRPARSRDRGESRRAEAAGGAFDSAAAALDHRRRPADWRVLHIGGGGSIQI